MPNMDKQLVVGRSYDIILTHQEGKSTRYTQPITQAATCKSLIMPIINDHPILNKVSILDYVDGVKEVFNIVRTPQFACSVHIDDDFKFQPNTLYSLFIDGVWFHLNLEVKTDFVMKYCSGFINRHGNGDVDKEVKIRWAHKENLGGIKEGIYCIPHPTRLIFKSGDKHPPQNDN